MTNETYKKVTYEQFGAVGDGKTDDFEAISKAHYHANYNGCIVCATGGKTYYIGPSSIRKPIPVRTDVDFSDATFIIDDTVLPPYDWGKNRHIFVLSPDADKMPYKIEGDALAGISLRAGQKNIGIKLPRKSLLHIVNENERQYIRYGGNANSGQRKQEVILVDEEGCVDESTPILWDYSELTEVTVYSAVDSPITVKGGKFITLCNKLCDDFPTDDGKVWHKGNQYYYYYRGISVQRSNSTLYGITHELCGEGDGGYPYSGWFDVVGCNNVLIEKLRVSGHKTFIEDRGEVKGSGTPMGSYDLGASLANNVTWRGLYQITSITDDSRWGVMGSNYTKNLTYDSCYLSRFDAHEGVYNATIVNSTIGLYINAIGGGTLRIENTKKLVGSDFISLRDDYGSTWNGDVIVKNCEHVGYVRKWLSPCEENEKEKSIVLFNGKWTDHNFGYTCYMPRTVTVENLKLSAEKLYVFNYRDFCAEAVDSKTNPFVLPELVTVSGSSGYEVHLGYDDKAKGPSEPFERLKNERKIEISGDIK